jgi:hypothetical protein
MKLGSAEGGKEFWKRSNLESNLKTVERKKGKG